MIEREQMPGEARPSCVVCGDIVGRRWMEDRLSNKRWTAYCLACWEAIEQQIFVHRITERMLLNDSAGGGEGNCNAKNNKACGAAAHSC